MKRIKKKKLIIDDKQENEITRFSFQVSSSIESSYIVNSNIVLLVIKLY